MTLPIESIDTTFLLTIVVCGLITIIALFSVFFRAYSCFKKKPIGPLTSLAPGAVISLGILGTFLGIYLGLRNFDTLNINTSIPSLLEGLKTAFITSLFGMSFSLIIKYIYGICDKIAIKSDPSAIDDPIVILKQISSHITSLSTELNSISTTILRCFQSDEEFSFISQLKIIRTDINDLKREITKSLDEFGEKVAQLGTEAMIEALRNVIDQFNARLNDLVGQEFKQLKDAMIKLNDWQEKHRQSVDEMQSNLATYVDQVQNSVNLLERVTTTLTSASEHLDSIDGSLSTITVSSEELEHNANRLKNQNAELKELLDSIKKLGEEAKDVLPSLTTHIDSSTSKLVEASETAGQKIEEAGKILGDNVAEVASNIDELVQKHAKQTDQAIEQIQKNLENVLEQSLTSLGGQLASLSNKFVEDYKPLTDQLSKIVQMAEQVQKA